MSIRSSPRISYLFFVICALAALELFALGQGAQAKRMVCYYVTDKYFPVQAVPANMCTHIINMAGGVTPGGVVPTPKTSPQVLNALASLKKQNPALKVMLSLTTGYSSVVDTGSVEVMTNFSKAAVKFLNFYNLDGFDMDWEFPTEKEYKNVELFIKTFSSNLKQSQKLLSAALPNNPFTFNTAYSAKILGTYLDFMTVMTYDFHAYHSADNITGYNSPLFAPSGESLLKSTAGMMTYFRLRGIPMSKLLMGLPLYGHSWTLASAAHHDLHAPAVGKGPPSPYSGTPDYWYPDTCVAIQNGATKVQDKVHGAAYLYHNTTWVAFDNEETIKAKMAFMRDLGFGGVGIWAMHLDDLPGVCKNGSLPLLRAIKSWM